jgi:hypothetical protein
MKMEGPPRKYLKGQSLPAFSKFSPSFRKSFSKLHYRHGNHSDFPRISPHNSSSFKKRLHQDLPYRLQSKMPSPKRGNPDGDLDERATKLRKVEPSMFPSAMLQSHLDIY